MVAPLSAQQGGEQVCPTPFMKFLWGRRAQRKDLDSQGIDGSSLQMQKLWSMVTKQVTGRTGLELRSPGSGTLKQEKEMTY